MTNTTAYTRPTNTSATKVGDLKRTRWTRKLEGTASIHLTPVEMLAARESVANATRKDPFGAVPAWTSMRLRRDQLAVIIALQARHLSATGKEISRNEVLAALMAAGMSAIIAHNDFSGRSV